ncbi:MAG: WG repeat-containing protein, partial [Prevotellaceae bacterium]|nr:WG repeat-containing protein [Prevotellaceae bacterium]
MKQLKLAVCIIAGLFMFTVGKSQTKDLFPTWKWVIKAQFEVAGSFYEGLAAIKKDGKWGFIDKIGAIVIQPEFDGVKNFSDGMAAVKKDGKWGYINRTGEIVISPVYHDAYNFREDIARVERFEKDEDYYINRNGHNTPVLPIKHKSKKLTPRPENNSAAFPSVRNGKYGFIDKNKNWVIPPQFIGAKEFADSMACVNQNGKWGFIRLLSPFEYVNEYIKSKIQTSQHADIGVEIITLFDKAIEDFVESSLFAMEFTLSDISDYDEVNNTFLISIHAFGKLVLKVEKEDARALRYNWSRVKFSEPVFTVARNIETGKPQIILTKIDIINPINKKIHTWSSHDRLDYKNVSQEETFEYIGMSEAFKDVFLQTGEPEIIEPEQETKNIEVKPETENIEPEQEKKNIEAKPETENIEPEQEKK